MSDTKQPSRRRRSQAENAQTSSSSSSSSWGGGRDLTPLFSTHFSLGVQSRKFTPPFTTHTHRHSVSVCELRSGAAPSSVGLHGRFKALPNSSLRSERVPCCVWPTKAGSEGEGPGAEFLRRSAGVQSHSVRAHLHSCDDAQLLRLTGEGRSRRESRDSSRSGGIARQLN